uniref:Sushi domain-containing protein n=1 Tax=Macrostomum lignano TaxID=282301 RepID=A0A1I8FBC9_9PLAT
MASALTIFRMNALKRDTSRNSHLRKETAGFERSCRGAERRGMFSYTCAPGYTGRSTWPHRDRAVCSKLDTMEYFKILPARPDATRSTAWPNISAIAWLRLNGHNKRLCVVGRHTWDGSDSDVQHPGLRTRHPFVPNALRPIYSSTTFGSTVAYTCMDGTKFEGENAGRIVCQNSGQWLPHRSVAGSTANSPTIPARSVYIGRAGGPIARAPGTNDRAMYSCYVGYEMSSGSSSVVCRYGKTLSLDKLRTQRCQVLLGPEGQKNPWTRPETLSDSEELVKFECTEKGHVLRGHTHAICV